MTNQLKTERSEKTGEMKMTESKGEWIKQGTLKDDLFCYDHRYKLHNITKVMICGPS